jgi:pimeloyl-ACP methyl ester carboxylesterase
VDLVGHDWGGGHVLNVAMARPDLIRSWVSDAAGLFDPGYEWHPLARIWQTPGEGERSVEKMMTAPLEQRVAAMLDLGIASPVAERLAAGQDAQMGRAILSLYRSAEKPALAAAARHLSTAAARPGLAISPVGDDTTGSEQSRRRVARLAGAKVAVLTGVGHWWMVQDPAEGARALTEFWSGLSESPPPSPSRAEPMHRPETTAGPKLN